MKQIGARSGYVFGMVLGVPLVAFIFNFFFLSGNRAGDKEVAQYLNRSKLETFTVDKWLDEGNEQYTVALQRGSNSAFLEWYTFYDKRYQKYFNLTTFDYLEPNQQGSLRSDFLYGVVTTTTFTAYLNQQQLSNPEYGTKEKPIPVWGKELLIYNGKDNTTSDIDYYNNKVEIFYVKPETNELFIQQYLSRFMPEDEYKRMFK